VITFEVRNLDDALAPLGEVYCLRLCPGSFTLHKHKLHVWLPSI
jgi:hypothetical protein